ncbi:MAG: trans-aconitate 2-methyltransferase [Tateyamaria sp.]
MTPEHWAAFLQVHKDLPREGPGLPEDVHWVLETLKMSGHVQVFDAACGPGDDTVTLAQALPHAQIRAVDKTQQFVDMARARTTEFSPRVHVDCADMAAPGGCYDLIWCAGALYFLGVTEGLLTWRTSLKPGGHIAFSEPVLLETPANDDVAAFWEEYPQITDLAGIEARVKAAGYRMLAHRFIVGAAWKAYYTPMQARIDALRTTTSDPDILAAVDDSQKEINQWRAASDQIAYALLIVAPE